ncbi:MAG: phosphoglucosamine mutase [Candidatus Methanomethylophilus sp.]|nr:phosphoglucosamine mutase [Methanomethylophilus sp.]
MTKMFGTNGVRGVVNQDMNVQKALQIGKAIGAVTPGVTAIATDTRYTCDMLKMAVSAGLMSVGCDVIDLGSLPTPALQYYVRTHSVVGGVMITASHNPPQFNGIKVIANDGTEASPQQEEAIEAKYDEEIAPVSWKDTGHTSRYVGAADDYVDAIVSKLDVDAIREANLTVVLDCTNGAAFYTSPLLLRRLGVRAITLNGNPQGEFPGHPSEPTEDNLQDLMKMVRDTPEAVLGIAHDGDADRCVFVDGEGNYVPGDKTLAILARSIVKENGGGIVVTPVATSSVIDETVSSVGGKVVRTAVGSPKVARRMIDDGGIFGGEENGGLIFADHQFCRDGGMAIGRMLESIIKIGPLKEQVDSLVPFYTVKKKLVCPDDLKESVLNFLDENTANIRKDTTDGLKLIFTNGWVLARASGTEPIFRVYAESRDKAVAEELASKYEAMVDEYLSSF